MNTAFRISLVEMFVAEEGDDTPRPFMEIRAFLFTDRMPEGLKSQSLRNSLRGWIELVKENFLGHIFGSERGDLESREGIGITPFMTRGKASFRSRLVIEGFEISELDEDELIQGHFKASREGQRFNLSTETPYFYVAFYKKGKTKPEEYDDAEIKKFMGKSIQLKNERERLIRKARGLMEDIEQKRVQLRGTTSEMQKTLGKFRRY